MTDVESLYSEISNIDLNPENTNQAISIVRDRLSIKNVAYLGFRHGLRDKNPMVHATYHQEWIDHYVEEKYVEIDPIVWRAPRTILSSNWSKLNDGSNQHREFFNQARLFGVGKEGLTVPIIGRDGDIGLFSVSTDMNADEWGRFLNDYRTDVVSLAHWLHTSLMKCGQTIAVKELPPMRKRILELLAQGKTAKEIARIMDISPRTVQGYLELTRASLNALNSTHAVAIAIKANLISH